MYAKALVKKGRGQRCQVNSHENQERMVKKKGSGRLFHCLGNLIRSKKPSIEYTAVCCK